MTDTQITREMYWPLPVFQPDGALTKGLPPEFCEDERDHCPLCNAVIDPTENVGYGLAYGGFGMYTVCSSDDCPWFYKEMDRG